MERGLHPFPSANLKSPIFTQEIERAIRILKRGGLVVFPTETVYGLGARLFDENAIKKIYAVKKRPFDNPLIVHIAEKSQLRPLVKQYPSQIEKLIEKFWPGPLTLVFKRSSLVPISVTAGLETVAVRMPSHPVALKLIRDLGEPIAAPSANLSSRPSPTRYNDVVKELGKKVALVLDGGKTEVGIESTVVDLTSIPFRLLRPGFITLESLRKVLSPIVAASKKSAQDPSRSPGTKHLHYKPNCEVVIVHPKKWKKSIEDWKKKDLRLGIISCNKKIPAQKNVVFNRCFFRDKIDYARNLYSSFLDAEEMGVDLLFVESVDEKGVGLAIMDRIKRASASD